MLPIYIHVCVCVYHLPMCTCHMKNRLTQEFFLPSKEIVLMQDCVTKVPH